jgi:hypothetical protein
MGHYQGRGNRKLRARRRRRFDRRQLARWKLLIAAVNGMAAFQASLRHLYEVLLPAMRSGTVNESSHQTRS